MACFVDRLADFRHRRKAPGGCFIVQKADRLDLLALVLAQARLNRGRIGPDAPVRRYELGNQADFLRHFFPEHGELARFHHEHLVAGRERIDERAFPGAGAGRGVDDDRIGGLEDRFDALEALLRKPREFRSAMVNNGGVHCPQDAVRQRRGPRNVQKMSPDRTRGILGHRHSAPETAPFMGISWFSHGRVPIREQRLWR
jgi:hypothetical protein